MKRILSLIQHSSLAAACGITLSAFVSSAAFAHGFGEGAVYAMTNTAAANTIKAFSIEDNGALHLLGTFPTAGKGTGAVNGLGSQGALALSRNHQWLFAVNAGSNELSVFAVDESIPELTDKQASGGAKPVSVTEHRGLIYVLNSGSDSITGFRINRHGKLFPIPNSTRYLANTGADAAQIQFSPDGEHIVITEKATNLIVTYRVRENGLLGNSKTYSSPTPTPFGFAFGNDDRFFVSEANGGKTNASSLSSYRLKHNNAVPITNASPTHQTAACWVTVTNNGHYTYTSNADSGTLSAFEISDEGRLQLVDANGRSADIGASNHPIDLATSRHSAFLYSLNSIGAINTYSIGEDGKLSYISRVQGLTPSASGLVAK